MTPVPEKENVMKKQELSPVEERKIKIAQIGILVAMVLAITVFVGYRVSNRTGAEPQVVGNEALTSQSADEVAAGPRSLIDGSKEIPGQAELAATASTEPTPEPLAEVVVEVEEPAVPVTYAEAEQTFRTGDYEEAASLFSRYVDQHQANAWGHYMLGLAEWRAGDADAAEDAFLQALERKPDHLKSLVNYGRVLIAQERYEEARTQLEAALAINPASIDAARVMGRVQHSLGELEKAESTYRAILTIRDKDVWALNNLGLVLIQQERFSEALSPLAKAASLNESEACIQNNLGIALENTGYVKEAGLAYARALICSAGYEKASTNLVRVEGRANAAELPPVDLAALAAGFVAQPVAVAEEERAAETPEVDMEVASALDSPTSATDEPE
jgi:Flp pilus assembly protein TadD